MNKAQNKYKEVEEGAWAADLAKGQSKARKVTMKTWTTPTTATMRNA